MHLNPLIHEFCFMSIFEVQPKVAPNCLPTHSRGAHRPTFFGNPSYFKIDNFIL